MLRKTDFDPAALVGRIATSDPEAEDRFVRHFLPTLTYILKSRFDDPDLVQDLVQDTLISAIRNLRQGKLRDSSALAGYVHSIAMNKCHAYLRGVYRRGVSVDPDQVPQLRAEDDVFASLEHAELAGIVRETIDSLPTQRDRDLLTQFYYHDVDKKYLCDQFGISCEHFDRVSFRARERLRKLVRKRIVAPVGVISLFMLLLLLNTSS